MDNQPQSPETQAAEPEVVDLVGRLVSAEPAHPADATAVGRARTMGALGVALTGSARRAGFRAIGSGRWLADIVLDIAPRIPVRGAERLSAHHDGLHGDALAAALIATASRSTAAVGAAGGALSTIEFTAPPTLLSAPVQIAAETVAVVAIELKLLAELHEVYGQRPPGLRRHRGAAYVTSWARERGFDPLAPSTLTGVVSTATRRELRARLLRRAGRNLTTLAPLLAGAVAGAELNRRETRRLGERVQADLSRRSR